MDADDQDLITRTLTEQLANRQGSDVSDELSAFGVGDLLGAHMTAAVPIVFGVQGSSGTTSRSLHQLAIAVLAPSLTPEWPVTAVLIASTVAGTSQRLDDGTIEVDAWAIAGLGDGMVLTAAVDEHGCTLAIINPATLTETSTSGVDPWLGLSHVQGRATPVWTLSDGCEPWEQAISWMRIALACEMIGACRASLELARTHALERVQFGRAIGTFQAVKHRLADVLVAVEAAEASVEAALSDQSPLAAMVAKSMAGRASRIAATNCLQVLGGIGFTWEHHQHHYQKRALALDRFLGSATELPSVIGQTILDSLDIPRLVEV